MCAIGLKEIKQWYDNRYIERGEKSWRGEGAYPIFLNYLSAQKGKTILDVGCGTGYLLKAAVRMGLNGYGIDVSSEGVKIAAPIASGATISVGSGENLKFGDNFFDYVICLGALEHFTDMQKGVAEMMRVAKDSARFCIMVPNRDFLYWKIKGKHGTDQVDINERLYSLREWEDFFIAQGMSVRAIHKDKWFNDGYSCFCPLRLLKKAAGALAYFFVPLRYTYQFIFILDKDQRKAKKPG